MNSVMQLPRYAKNKVFVVVPRMSFPMFIPDRNSSFLDSLGLLVWTSYKADDIAIEVSIMFPIKPIITTDIPKFIIFKPVSNVT